MPLLSGLSFLLLFLVAPETHAYEVGDGDMVLRANVGARVQVQRLETVTRETPPAAMLLGATGAIAELRRYRSSAWGAISIARPQCTDRSICGAQRLDARGRSAQQRRGPLWVGPDARDRE